MSNAYVVIDTETTGMDETDEAIDVGAVCRDSGTLYHSLIKPTVPIKFPAMATHHITEDMVEYAMNLSFVQERMLVRADIGPDTYIVAHNAAFDQKYLPALQGHRWICTWRCARHIYPDAQSHKNQSLRYELGLPVESDMPEELGNLAHRAGYDAWCTDWLLKHMLSQGHTLGTLYELQSKPVLLKTCDFGKHRGSLWGNIPPDYLQWALRQDFDEDVKYTARHWLEQRTGRRF